LDLWDSFAEWCFLGWFPVSDLKGLSQESKLPESSLVSGWSVPSQALCPVQVSPSLGLDSRSRGSGLLFQAELSPESALIRALLSLATFQLLFPVPLWIRSGPQWRLVLRLRFPRRLRSARRPLRTSLQLPVDARWALDSKVPPRIDPQPWLRS
jgi:hypothetical protein